MNLQESIRKILREEMKLPNFIKRRYNCMDEYITKLENGEETLPIRMGQLDKNGTIRLGSLPNNYNRFYN